MIFSTQIFIFIVLPLSIISFYLAELLEKINCLKKFLRKIRLKELILIAFSFCFYSWMCFETWKQLLIYILVVYVFGYWLQSVKNKGCFISVQRNTNEKDVEYKRFFVSTLILIFTIILLILFLVHFKYSEFLIEQYNKLFNGQREFKSVVAPLGISFITFSAISYLMDIHKGKATASSIIDCALYISFFPKIISGPIVLWQNFQNQINDRAPSIDLGISGFNRLIIGLAKKVLIADVFGSCLESIGTNSIDNITAIGIFILYALQIYFDFSGYSDMAIGISRIFGFKFNENFNFPYRSKSITEFWRRWHISLGAWFKEYVYFPLGGSRAGRKRTLINLTVVFILTGIWHGAGKNYILWGLINAICIVIERIIKDKKFYIKTPSAVKYIVTMFIVTSFWQLFYQEDLDGVKRLVKIIFGLIKYDDISYTWQYYFDFKMIIMIVIGIVGSTALGNRRVIEKYNMLSNTKMGFIFQETLLIVLFLVSIFGIVNSTYSPFIYFQY